LHLGLAWRGEETEREKEDVGLRRQHKKNRRERERLKKEILY